MINKLILKNFQSWKELFIEFGNQVNILVGSSNSGKSALLRAIYWIIENRPLGNSFVNWSQLSKNEIKGKVSAEIEVDGRKVRRYKDKDTNCYYVEDKKFEALGTNIPEEVTKTLNLNEINIQKQFDTPFLLFESGGEVARFFNRILKLDVIDVSLKKIDEIKRENNRKIVFNTQELQKITVDLESLDWIEEFGIKIDKLERVLKKEEEVIGVISEFKKYIEDIILYNEQIDKIEKILIVKNKVEKVLDVEKDIEEKSKDLFFYKEMFQLITEIDTNLQKYDDIDFLSFNKIIENFISINQSIIDKTKNFEEFMEFLYNLEKIESKMIEINEDFHKIMIEIPDICPLCGNVVDKNKIMEKI